MSALTDRRVIDLDSADPAEVALLGGKGAGLAEMRRLGIAVPPGFIITTEVCRSFLAEGRLGAAVQSLIQERLRAVEDRLQRRLGDAHAPLLLSVRSGAPVSMPGMMDTVLNLGLTEQTVRGLARLTGNEYFALDCYARLLRAYGVTVRGLPTTSFMTPHAAGDGAADLEAMRATVNAALASIAALSGRPFPQDPDVQLQEAIGAVFQSWNSPRADRYRRYAGISDALGSAVVVQAMVFGNLDEHSGTGVAFTRNPATGAPQTYGDFLTHAQGEDVVAGEHDVQSLEDCADIAPQAYQDLRYALGVIEAQRRDMCEVEFTIERGRLWMLQTRIGQRTGTAAVRIALDLLEQGVISVAEAIARIPPAALARLGEPELDPTAARTLLGKGTAASPGAAIGRVALTSASAEAMAADGGAVILVRPFTSPEDIAGMIAAQGIVTARGGRTSHAAVVARGMNRPAVCGVRDLVVTPDGVRFGAVWMCEGDEISLDGTRGEVYAGALPLSPATPDPRVEQLLGQCDARRVWRLLSEGGPRFWSDGLYDPAAGIICVEPDDVEHLMRESPGKLNLVLDLSAAENATGLINTAVRAAAAARLNLLIRTTGQWPASLPALPPGPWAGIVATDEGQAVARLLAASASSGSSK